MGFLYCGVSKNVQLKVYSSVLDWFIFKHIDKEWDFGSYTFNDGEAMSMLLSSGAFVGDNLSKVIATCLIRRSFTTRANLNTRAHVDCLAPYFKRYQDQHEDIDVKPFKAYAKSGMSICSSWAIPRTRSNDYPGTNFSSTTSWGRQHDPQ